MTTVRIAPARGDVAVAARVALLVTLVRRRPPDRSTGEPEFEALADQGDVAGAARVALLIDRTED